MYLRTCIQCNSGVIQVDCRRAKHLENISCLQLYEYELDKSLCPNIPSAMPLKINNENVVCNHNNGVIDNPLQMNQATTDRGVSGRRARVDDQYPLDVESDDLYPTNTGRVRCSEEAERCCSRARRGGGMEGARRQVGLMAQEVEQVLPNAVRITVSSILTYTQSQTH